MEPTQAQPRIKQVWFWWNSLDGGVQRVLNDIAARAPQAVAEVIGGPDAALLTPPPGTPFGDHLWSRLSAVPGGDAQDRPSDVVVTETFRPEAQNTGAGREVGFVWAETNFGGSGPRGAMRRAKIVVQDEQGEIVAQSEQRFETPEPQRTAQRRMSVRGIPQGRYWARLFAPYADGLEYTPGSEAQPAVEVRVGDASANERQGAAASPADEFGEAMTSFSAAAAAIEVADPGAATTYAKQAVAAFNRALRLAGARYPAFDGIDLDRQLGRQQPGVTAESLRNASLAAGRLRDNVLALLAAGQGVDGAPDVRVADEAVRVAVQSSQRTLTD